MYACGRADTFGHVRFLVEVSRLADGTAVGRVTVPATGRTEVFHGWRALLALLADDQPAGADRPAIAPDAGRRMDELEDGT